MQFQLTYVLIIRHLTMSGRTIEKPKYIQGAYQLGITKSSIFFDGVKADDGIIFLLTSFLSLTTIHLFNFIYVSGIVIETKGIEVHNH